VNDGFESDDPVPDVGFDPLLSQLGLPGQNAPNRIHQVFGVTFYPGAASATSAAPVEVTSGSDISGMDIVVNPSGRYTVRGFVIDERTGRPPEVASLNLLPAEGEPLSQFTGAPRPPRPDLQPD
jgi:hypothetical protein